MTSLSSPTSTGLEPLQRAFADYLQETSLYPGLKTVTCSERAGRLLLLAEHPAPEVNFPNDLLKELETAFRDLVPVVGLPDADWAVGTTLSVRIYLKVNPAADAYAIHTFTWQPEDAAAVVFPIAEAGADPVDPPRTSPLPGPPGNDTGATETGLSTASRTEAEPFPPFNDAALALPTAAVQAPPPPNPWVQRGRHWARGGARLLRYYWSYGLAALILVGSGALAYAITRPCVVGNCDRLDQAAELNQSAQITLIGQPNGEDLAVAQADLQAAIDLLTPVPTWSAYYGEAQADLQRYQSSIVSLNALIQAQAIAQEAAQLSQNPPHPVERWVKVHLLWQQSVDRLATIPTESPAFDFAQQKLREYRANHSAIGRRIVAEEEAEANFSTAIQTAHLARQRTETANSLAGWQLATKEWQAAIKGLSLIPQGTMAYTEAQAQLQDYQDQLRRATNRSVLEEAGAHHYNQAVQAARAAAAYEAKSQWTQAVAQWRQAVASAQAIPTDTILAEDGAILLETYQPALANAQTRLRTAVTLQNLTVTLAQLCEFSATPCTVREDANQLRVVLSSQYAEPLRQAITPPAADGTFAFTNSISLGSQQIIDQIITVSHQINRPVAIYDAQGGFVARYRPDLGGFIRN
jgi:hypothetical protein